MKVVRLESNTVVEIIPGYALPVEEWYGEEFASQCIEAPEDVKEGWVHNPDTNTFSGPVTTPTTEEQIAVLKAQISTSDYKVIKCAECSLAGLPAPYDIVALNTERQAIRDQINALEASNAR
ncbi:MAG: hypothetical protein CVU91_07500 [Firmicutes bacterium HGW-Firmicutes-16]|nr:MAG: hypothetical protein CVU91_07500 [Firmicutes bacterium HGW-Firmicutes-16]